MMKNIKRMLGMILAAGALCSSIGSVRAEFGGNLVPSSTIVNALNCSVTVAVGSATPYTIAAYGQSSQVFRTGASIVVTLPPGYVPTSGYSYVASTNSYTASHTPTSSMISLTVSSGGLIPSPQGS